MPKKKFTAEMEAIVCSRYLAGENTIQLGDAFGVAHTTIGGILKRNGVKMRSKSEAKRSAAYLNRFTLHPRRQPSLAAMLRW